MSRSIWSPFMKKKCTVSESFCEIIVVIGVKVTITSHRVEVKGISQIGL